MVHQMNQAIGHAFANHAPIMANHVHDAMLKRYKIEGHLVLWDQPTIREVKWSSLLLDRLLGHHRSILKPRLMRVS